MSAEQIHELTTNAAKDANNDPKKKQYSSTCSMFVTLLKYAMGMSDIWRFPFLVYRNGGGSFLIPFVITVVLCGIPLYFSEYSVSNFSEKGPFGIWEISPIFKDVGVSVAIAYFLWMVGSSVFRSWLAMFLLDSFKSPLPWTHCQNAWNTPTCRDNPFVAPVTNLSILSNVASMGISYSGTNITATLGNNSDGMIVAEEYWQYEAIGLSSGITDLSPILWKHILCMLVLRIVVFLSLVKSIKSIEKIMYID